MKRVLQIVDCMDLGGIQSFIMNTYRGLVKRDIQFDFLVFHERKQFYEDEILSMGGKIFKLPARRNGALKSRWSLEKFFQTHPEYDVVHYQTSSLSFLTPLEEAYKNHVPVRIVHSHSTNAPGSKVHYYLHQWNKRKIHKIANYYFTCGNLAGEWMFSGSKCENKVRVINNGIDTEKYKFNEKIRDEVRTELGIKNEYVIGHVGRFSQVKNHKFLIEVFEKIHAYKENNFNPILTLIGSGDLQQEIMKMCKSKGLTDCVKFLGARNDIHRILQAMDAFVLPSIYEGFPVSAIEAQAAGLPCFLSDSITEDTKLKDNVHMISLNDTAEQWAKRIIKDRRRIVDNEILVKHGYDLNSTLLELEKVYLSRKNDINTCTV